MKIVITGASGFVGSHMAQYFKSCGHEVIELKRSSLLSTLTSSYSIEILNYFRSIFNDVQVVIHCAGIAHRLADDRDASWSEYSSVNVDATLRLADLAAQNNVKRFIFLSSVKVCGENTNNSDPFSEVDPPNPSSHYALSKHLAEIGLIKLAKLTSMEFVIVRPPLIYGRGVKANFKNLINWIKDGKPLPFACLNANKRSFISIENLNDFIGKCTWHPNAANQIFFVSDGNAISTAELMKKIGFALGKRTRLLPFPVSALALVSMLFSKYDLFSTLSSSLEVNISKSRDLMSWEPPVNIDIGLKNTCANMDQL
ncbi:UDP-glucose 4-epimerase [Polynucleobacter yangtzensis]|uniref:UDP-glucose 4-epimerase n=2 Tax=Polynucleobacter yangtzensis TaxID=1743159 RepID=A0ABM8CKV8_9BURK|nr:UDP-glucose 4-epimerase [Polynucleobacter yangtzensis]